MKDLVKNLISKKFRKKYLLISVDDYGNVRLDSSKARQHLDRHGLPKGNRFDQFDSMETTEDLEALFHVLAKHKDYTGRHPSFTAYTLSANPDFDSLLQPGNTAYSYQTLPQTFERLSAEQPSAYTSTWQLWQEGMQKGLIHPEFHGREHLSVSVLEHCLQKNDPDLRAVLEQRSLIAWPGGILKNQKWSQAFSSNSPADWVSFPSILQDGLRLFEETFGRQATVFTAPSQTFPTTMMAKLPELGVHYMDRPARTREGSAYFNGFKKNGITAVVRNVVFEPTEKDEMARTLKMIKQAFKAGNVAHVSSHRVNYAGHIDPNNRKLGLQKLDELLSAVLQRWPDVEFINAAELVQKF